MSLQGALVNGELLKYAWPGGYPIVYFDMDNEPMCPDCAQKEIDDHEKEREEAQEHDMEAEVEKCRTYPVAYDVHYEGPDIICAECNKAIPSAYGDPEATVEVRCQECDIPFTVKEGDNQSTCSDCLNKTEK